MLASSLRKALLPLVDVLYPPRCPLCGAGIAAQTGLCADCWGDLEIPGEPSCSLCNRPLNSTHMGEGAVCAPCLSNRPGHDGIAAGTIYNDASRRLVLSFKYGKRIALAPMMARLMAARLPELDGEWRIVPVPLHRGRIWQRGFNQAALLAQEVSRLTGKVVVVDGLLRRKATPQLGGLGRKARARTMAGAIAVNPRRASDLKGAQVLLVDDVLTSGATSEACLSALRRAGAEKVVIACFARVLDDGQMR